jgi:hypothetical protein
LSCRKAKDIQVELAHQRRPEDKPDDPYHPEHARFDHRHGVQQGADRGGGGHCRGKPAVQGHDGGLDPDPAEKKEK